MSNDENDRLDGYLGVEAALPARIDLDASAFAIDLALRLHPEHPRHGIDGVEWDGAGEIPDAPRTGSALCRCGVRLPVKRE